MATGMEGILMGVAWLNLFILALGLIFFITAILGVVFWIVMIIDCVKRTFKNDNEKIAWILILVFLHALGAAIYYFVVKRKAK